MIASLGLWLGILIAVVIPVRHLIAPTRPALVVEGMVFAGILVAIPALLRRNYSTTFCSNLLIFCISGVGFISGLNNGGVRAPAVVVFVLTPIIGFFSAGTAGAITALFFSGLSLAVLLVGEHQSWVMPLNSPDRYSDYKAFIYMAGAVVAYLIGAAYERSRRISEELIEKLSVTASQALKMASLGEMSAGIAHEINNPLAIIMGSAGLLKKLAHDPEKFAVKIDAIEKSCLRISKIISGLRKFSRTSDLLDRSRRSLKEIVAETIVLTEAKAQRQDTQLIVEGDAEAQIYCNEIEVEQVLVNLIQNAIDAVRGLPEKWVKISVTGDGSFVVLRVTDSGPGISDAIRAKIFDPFFTTKPTGEGTGLGLSITKGILDAHGASIALVGESANTCFEIRFKRAVEVRAA